MLITEFKENRLNSLPDELYLSLPEFCPTCGYPTEVSETLTGLHCSNPKCPDKLAQRLVAIANQIGVKDLGEAKAAKFVDLIAESGSKNILLIFAWDPAIDGCLEGVSLEVCEKIAEQFRQKRTFTLAEYVKVANLPFIQTSALTIFRDYDDIEQAYNDIEEGGIDFIKNILGIKEENAISVRALKILESLTQFKSDLVQAIPYVNIIKKQGVRTITAVCSDEVGAPFKTKADFYATVNSRYADIHVEFLSAVNKNIDYLVWAGADGITQARYTNKVKKIEGYNEKGPRTIPIVTAQQFIDILDNM